MARDVLLAAVIGAQGLKGAVKAEDVFDPQYLPAKADRMLP